MQPDDPPPPPMIPGYDILRSIGGGGMGVVYLAHQRSLGREVAIKVLSSTALGNLSELAARFRREAELMARLHHPNIVDVHEFGEIDGRQFLVMEYVDGKDLRHFMRPGIPLEISKVRPLVLPLASALECLHRNGILHRDFKPENIMIGQGLTPKVTDFGIAVEYGGTGLLTKSNQWLGTIGYVAPEQQYRLRIDERADQYSMAAVMYEALTGSKALGVFKHPSQLNPRLGSRVDEVLMKALQEDREDRFPTIQAFGAALDAALAPMESAASMVPTHIGFSDPPTRIDTPPKSEPTPISTEIDSGPPSSSPTPHPPQPIMHQRADSTSSTRPVAVLILGLAFFAAGAVGSWWILTWVVPPDGRRINSVGMVLMPIPAGEFIMGSSGADSLASPNERPAHRVKITRAFDLGIHEVTVGQFREFVRATDYVTEAEADGRGGTVFDFDRRFMMQDPKHRWSEPTPGGPAADQLPVVQVTYNDANAFCEWLSRKEGRTYRLPTEAEWEYAARGGSTGRWCMGDDPGALDAYAWTEKNAGFKAHPVGGKAPNQFGLHDMHGNVWEMTSDHFAPYQGTPAVDPVGPAFPAERTLRGGSWEPGELRQTRSAARRDSPTDYPYFAYGFRICAPK